MQRRKKINNICGYFFNFKKYERDELRYGCDMYCVGGKVKLKDNAISRNILYKYIYLTHEG